jgi:hypothetical protein
MAPAGAVGDIAAGGFGAFGAAGGDAGGLKPEAGLGGAGRDPDPGLFDDDADDGVAGAAGAGFFGGTPGGAFFGSRGAGGVAMRVVFLNRVPHASFFGTASSARHSTCHPSRVTTLTAGASPQ